ncbi:MAG TPA: PHP domain-containing protein [Oscillospiraceae bacterium]|nr:PHP domain-containing protein [Oscillospiraceae bacterium]HNW03970.1 PHP domain-containing protein [Oscillospiraceae bacterium]
MNKPNYPVDLHTHSVHSDGNDTVRELIGYASEAGMKAIALTDHDIRPPETIEAEDGSPVSPVDYARSRGLVFIPGIEYSCDTDVDDVHIVGLGCDFGHPALLKAEKDAEQSKTRSYKRLTEILCGNGIEVSWDDVRNGTMPPRKPKEVQRKHIFEAMAQKGYAASWDQAKIMVRDNPVFNVRREKIDPLEAIRIIHAAGGIAILAHPHLIDELVPRKNGRISRYEYIENLIAAGLDGIEACYPYEKTSYKGTLSRFEVEREIRYRYTDKLAIISGGSDYHDDGKKGVRDPRFIGECGVTWDYFANNPLLQRFV